MTDTSSAAPRPSQIQSGVPRRLQPGHEPSDRMFHGGARAIGMSVLAITAAIGLFLGYQSIPTLHHYGLHFFTQSNW